MHCLTNLLFFGIPLLYCYTNFNSSIICCLSSGDKYLFFGTSFRLALPASFEIYLSASVSSFRNFFVDFFETLVVLSAILLPVKSSVASAVFGIALFEAAFIASVVDFLALSKSF